MPKQGPERSTGFGAFELAVGLTESVRRGERPSELSARNSTTSKEVSSIVEGERASRRGGQPLQTSDHLVAGAHTMLPSKGLQRLTRPTGGCCGLARVARVSTP